jgi:hypothetical protein
MEFCVHSFLKETLSASSTNHQPPRTGNLKKKMQAKGAVTNKQKIKVFVLGAKGLVKGDTFSPSDPFCTLIVRSRGYEFVCLC